MIRITHKSLNLLGIEFVTPNKEDSPDIEGFVTTYDEAYELKEKLGEFLGEWTPEDGL